MKIMDKIRIANYTLDKSAEGFQLLRNQKGTPPSIVKLLKYERTMGPMMDVFETYTRITKDFSNPDNSTTENLHIVNYTQSIDKDNKSVSRTKVSDYYKYQGENSPKLVDYRTKGEIPNRENLYNEADNAVYPKEIVTPSIKFNPKMPDGLMLLPKLSTTTINESLYDIEAEKFHKKEEANAIFERKYHQGFFTKLFKNLFSK